MAREKSGICGKVMTIVITLAMLMSGVLLAPGNAEASTFQSEMDYIPSDIDLNGIGSGQDVYLVDIRAPPYYRPAFTDKNNQLELRIMNDGDSMALIKVNLYHVEPDRINESFIKTIHPMIILKGQEKTFNAFKQSEDMWQPTEIGRNWIRGEIYTLNPGEGWNLVNEFKESFWVVPGSRPIMELGDTIITEPTTWENVTVIVDGDLTVAETGVLNTGNTNIFAGDLNVSGTYNISAGESFNMECSSDGQFAASVYSSGTLNIWGNLTNDPDTKHYWFYMNGTLNISYYPDAPQPGLVEFTHGDTTNLSNPGGIICTTNNVNIEEGAIIREGATHGIFFMNNSGGNVKDSYIMDNGGDGIVCIEGSSPTIESNEITWNERYGVYAKNSTPIIKNNDLIQYNRGHGIYLEDITSASARVEGNTIKQNYASGIYAESSNITIANNTISSNGLGLRFRDTMENGVENWTATGMWHRVNNESGEGPSWNLSHSGEWSWWYGNDTTGDYSDGSHNWGNLTSETINLQNATTASLVFWSLYETDTTGTVTDQRWVIVKNNTLNASYQISGGSMEEWSRQVLNLSQFAGKNITVTFCFNTTNDENNSYLGWYVDDVEVISAYPALEGHGIYLQNTGCSNIINNTINSNNWDGIYCEGGENVTISKGQMANNSRHSIYLLTSNNNTLTENEIHNSFDNVFSIIECRYANSTSIEDKNILSGGGCGVLIYDCQDVTIKESDFSDFVSGISIRLSSDNIIADGNNLTDCNMHGIYLCNSNATVSNNWIHNNSCSGICYGHNSKINITGNMIVGNGNNTSPWFAYGGGIVDYGNAYVPIIEDNIVSYNYKGIHVKSDCGTTITNSTITGSVLYDILICPESYLTTLNTTFNKSSVYIYNQGNLIVQWYLDVHVIDTVKTSLGGVKVSVKDINEAYVSNKTTDCFGYTYDQIITERIQNSTDNTTYNNHNVSVSYEGMQANVSANVIGSMLVNVTMNFASLRCEVDGDDINLTWNYSAYPGASYYEIYRGTSPDNIDFSTAVNTTSDENETYWIDTGAVSGATEYYYVLAIFNSTDRIIFNSEIVGKYTMSFASEWNVFALPLLPFPIFGSCPDDHCFCDWILIDNDSPDAISNASTISVYQDGWKTRASTAPEFVTHRKINPVRDGLMVYMDNTDNYTWVGWPAEQIRLSELSDANALDAPTSPDIAWADDDLNITWNSVASTDHYEVFASEFRTLSSFDFTDPVYSGNNLYWIDGKANETIGERYYLICAVDSDSNLGNSTYSLSKYTCCLSSGWNVLTTPPFEPFKGETCGSNHRLCDWTLIDASSSKAIPNASTLSTFNQNGQSWNTRTPTTPWFVSHYEINVTGDCFMAYMDNKDSYTWIS